jgi:beta-lactamase regulating signal transducer with metallopeptidase domain
MIMNWLHYLLEANVYLAVAYGCYWLLFRKQTFYLANRLYLLLSTVVCFVIPLVQIDVLKPQVIAASSKLTTVDIIKHSQLPATAEPCSGILTVNKAITALYITISVVVVVLFILKLYSLLKLISENRKCRHQEYTLIITDHGSGPFSFFGYLFVDSEEALQDTVLQHELTHIRQKHSVDIVFTEILKIFNWFNPVVYLLQNSLRALHEYEADYYAANIDNPDNYVTVLITQAYENSGIPFGNHFSNKPLLKSRIMKLYQKRSGKLAKLNYLLAVPLCAGLLCASTMAFSKNYGWINLNFQKHVIKNLPLITMEDTVKKLRLKVTNGSVTGITDKLELKGYKGEKMVFTAQTLTAQDRKELMQNFGIKVETTDASASTTSIMVPPPPPPVEAPIPGKNKQTKLPPPPPPTSAVAKQRKSKDPVRFPAPKVETVKFPAPKVKTVRFPPPKIEVIRFPPPSKTNEKQKNKLQDSSNNK